MSGLSAKYPGPRTVYGALMVGQRVPRATCKAAIVRAAEWVESYLANGEGDDPVYLDELSRKAMGIARMMPLK